MVGDVPRDAHRAPASSHRACPTRCEAAITRLASTERLLVALDFDGTLAPLVDRPEDARATDRSRAAIERLAAADDTRVAIVSGRALESLGEVASPPDGTLLSGSHGVELQLDPAGVTIDLRDSELAKLERLSSHRRGGRGGCRRRVDRAQARGPRPAHARGSARPPARRCSTSARDKVEAELLGITVRTGKAVLEFAVRSSDKGESLTRLRQHVGATATIYVGDDVTDEDAFAALDDDDVGVKVGQGKSIATYRVRSPEDVAELLERLADARDAAREGASPWT